MQNQKSSILGMLAMINADRIISKLPPRITNPFVDILKAALPSLPSIAESFIFAHLFGPFDNLNDPKSHWQGNFPAETTGKNVAHWIQAVQSPKQFRRFQANKNDQPSLYPLANVQTTGVKLAIIYGDADAVATAADHQTLIARLGGPSTLVSAPVVIPKFAHMDFTYADVAATAFHPQVLTMLSEYGN